MSRMVEENPLFDYDAMTELVKRTVKVIMSCNTIDQLWTATKFYKLATKRYEKLIYSKQLSGQFGLDMVTLLQFKIDEIIKPKPNHNPFIS